MAKRIKTNQPTDDPMGVVGPQPTEGNEMDTPMLDGTDPQNEAHPEFEPVAAATPTAPQAKEKGPAVPRPPFTSEQKALMSEKMKTYWSTHEHPSKGKPMSDEAKARLRERMQGRPGVSHTMTPEARALMSVKMKEYWSTHVHPLKGKTMSDEAKAKLKAKALERAAVIKEALAAAKTS